MSIKGEGKKSVREKNKDKITCKKSGSYKNCCHKHHLEKGHSKSRRNKIKIIFLVILKNAILNQDENEIEIRFLVIFCQFAEWHTSLYTPPPSSKVLINIAKLLTPSTLWALITPALSRRYF